MSGPRQVGGGREGKTPSLKVEAHLRSGRGYGPVREGLGPAKPKGKIWSEDEGRSEGRVSSQKGEDGCSCC